MFILIEYVPYVNFHFAGSRELEKGLLTHYSSTIKYIFFCFLAVIQPPPTWSKMDGNDLETVVLSPASEEYKKIEREFLQSSQHKDIPPFKVTQV